jgi:hypothetical protein
MKLRVVATKGRTRPAPVRSPTWCHDPVTIVAGSCSSTVVIGIAAGVTDAAIGRHSSSDSYPIPWDVTFGVTGSSHSANVRYTLGGTFATEEDDIDIPELTALKTRSFPYFVDSAFPRGSHVFIEVRNNLPTGDVGCTIDYGLGSGPPTENHAHGASVARCDVYLK